MALSRLLPIIGMPAPDPPAVELAGVVPRAGCCREGGEATPKVDVYSLPTPLVPVAPLLLAGGEPTLLANAAGCCREAKVTGATVSCDLDPMRLGLPKVAVVDESFDLPATGVVGDDDMLTSRIYNYKSTNQ